MFIYSIVLPVWQGGLKAHTNNYYLERRLGSVGGRGRSLSFGDLARGRGSACDRYVSLDRVSGWNRVFYYLYGGRGKDNGGLPVGIWKGFRSGLGIFSRYNLENQLLNSRFSKI